MTDGEWSAWKVWWHPRMALDALIDSEIMENEYIRRLLAAETKIKDMDSRSADKDVMLEEQRKECERLSAEVERLAQRCAESEKAHAETRRLLDNALEELSEYEDIDRQLMEFEKMLSGIEEMKRNYEKRIKDLKARLREAGTQKSTDADILETPGSAGSDDWLMQLPDDL